MKSLLAFVCAVSLFAPNLFAQEKFVGVISMDMLILPGTAEYLKKSIEKSSREGAALLIVELDTPGGLLDSSQEMIQTLFSSPIPVVIYVSPTGGTATSAGVFITLAGHVAAMAPGTSIGAAHPVQGDGKNIEGDMRQKAENMTVAMVRSISEQRGRNVAWAEKAVKESNSVTEKEALKLGVVDLVAQDIPDLLTQVRGREIQLPTQKVRLDDYSKLPVRRYTMEFRDRAVNVLANPNVAALLWLGATTGLSIELYNPGAIIPGVVGVICLILALAVTQIIPLSQGGILLLIVGSLLIGLDIYVGSGLLGIGGVIAIVLGALYLVDISEAPGLIVNAPAVIAMGLAAGGLLLFIVSFVAKAQRRTPATGFEGLLDKEGKALETFTTSGRVSVNGELWKAVPVSGIITKGDTVRVVEIEDGLVLKVESVEGLDSGDR